MSTEAKVIALPRTRSVRRLPVGEGEVIRFPGCWDRLYRAWQASDDRDTYPDRAA